MHIVNYIFAVHICGGFCKEWGGAFRPGDLNVTQIYPIYGEKTWSDKKEFLQSFFEAAFPIHCHFVLNWNKFCFSLKILFICELWLTLIIKVRFKLKSNSNLTCRLAGWCLSMWLPWTCSDQRFLQVPIMFIFLTKMTKMMILKVTLDASILYTHGHG